MLVLTHGMAAAAMVVALASTSVAQTRVPVWIDTDPALGEPERDVDDGLALVHGRGAEAVSPGLGVFFVSFAPCALLLDGAG